MKKNLLFLPDHSDHVSNIFEDLIPMLTIYFNFQDSSFFFSVFNNLLQFHD